MRTWRTQACKKEQRNKDSACKEFSCDRREVGKLLNKLEEKRKNLVDARRRNNRSAIASLERTIKQLEDTLRDGWEADFDTRADHLTARQQAVIVQVLESLERGERFSHYRTRIRAALDSWRAVLAHSTPAPP